jgi:hypothetical protein
MTARTGDIDDVPRMPAERWAEQPVGVWRAVEAACWESWPMRTQVGSPVPVGWLDRATGERGEALGVPVGRLFTACALARRAGR